MRDQQQAEHRPEGTMSKRFDGFRPRDGATNEGPTEPSDGGSTHSESPTPPAFQTAADAANRRMAARRREREQRQQMIDEGRNRDDVRQAVFDAGARRRNVEIAESRLIDHTATAADARLVAVDRLNAAFEQRHADLFADNRALALAQTAVQDILRDKSFAGASADTIADCVAQSVHRQLAETSEPMHSQSDESRQSYIDSLRGQRQGTPTRQAPRFGRK
jgi:hypothetical protein